MMEMYEPIRILKYPFHLLDGIVHHMLDTDVDTASDW
jgi:hypothetical protein